ncbi:MAG: hypothetical protein JWR42_461, partial [Marmoricola sp.]|nr:hypothetical protein [Marmoricola sp.]
APSRAAAGNGRARTGSPQARTGRKNREDDGLGDVEGMDDIEAILRKHGI